MPVEFAEMGVDSPELIGDSDSLEKGPSSREKVVSVEIRRQPILHLSPFELGGSCMFSEHAREDFHQQYHHHHRTESKISECGSMHHGGHG